MIGSWTPRKIGLRPKGIRALCALRYVVYTFSMKCSLCNQEVGSGGTYDIAGLSVCEGCHSASYLPTRLTDRGIHLGFWYRNEMGVVRPSMESLTDAGQHTITALAETPHASGIHAKLQHEGFSAKLNKLFEQEIGNEAFDNMVWIRTSTKDETRAFLSLSGVQAAIMELIDMKAAIDIDGAKIYLKAETKGSIPVQQLLLYSAALAHYLSEFAAPASE
jgi:hypothetical protein